MTRAEVTRKLDEIIAFAEVDRFIDTPVKRYSSGMCGGLRRGRPWSQDLIVDEVLAVGDAAFQRKCIGKMGSVAHGGARCSSSATTWPPSPPSARAPSCSRTAG